MKLKRSSAVLLHITSLPSPYGIGDLGEGAYRFVDFLQKSGHSYWQILPLNPTAGFFGHSPYSSFSAFAGNPLLISPDLLVEEKLLDKESLQTPMTFDDEQVEFDKVSTYKYRLIDKAYQNFLKNEKPHVKAFEKFQEENQHWLEDYALYQVLKEKFISSWTDWPEKIRNRDPEMLTACKKQMDEQIKRENFIQFLFFKQWQQLEDYAHQKGIGLFGDIPFYINHDSADCWAHSEYFKLDEEKKPIMVSGVPPDYFSESGQLWGTPVFDWEELRRNNFDWWLDRLKQNFKLFDIVRLDHFRAFAAYWEVPVEEKTAINGQWADCPGMEFFKVVQKEFPDMPFVAEDLGHLDQPVYDLLEAFDFPGMKVLQFAFGDGIEDNPYIMHNHTQHSLVFTGTHDNNTTVGWYNSMRPEEKENFAKYLGITPSRENIHHVLHRLALMSVCEMAIVPVQDLIGLDEKAIMNRPGTSQGNWIWRLKADQMPWNRVEELREMNIRYNRLGKDK